MSRDTQRFAQLAANVAALNGADRAVIQPGSALALPNAEPFDLVFADPPYSPGSGSQAVAAVARMGWLAPLGWMSVETARGERVEPGEWAIEAERDVGRARLTLLASRQPL